MFFTKKKDEHKIRVEDIGNNRQEDIPAIPRYAPNPTYSDIRNVMEKAPTYQEPKKLYVPAVQRAPVYQEPKEYGTAASAPLFVKVERYKEVLRDVHELKLYISGIKQLLDLMHDVETIRLDAWKIMRATIQRIDKTLVEVDSELLRPRGSIMADIKTDDTEAKHIESSLADLQKNLAELKRELQEFR